jgi:hypothetical protein
MDLGVILMVAGVVGFAISLVVFVAFRRAPSAPSRSLDREVVDSSGHKTEVHERQN